MIRKMVHFLYSGFYGTSMRGEEKYGPVSGLQVHARMFALGDKYDIPALREFAVTKFATRLRGFSTHLDVLECVSDVYQLTPPSVIHLRDLLSKETRVRLERYLKYAGSREAFESIIAEVPEFATDVLDVYMNSPLQGQCMMCNRVKPVESVSRLCFECHGKPTDFR